MVVKCCKVLFLSFILVTIVQSMTDARTVMKSTDLNTSLAITSSTNYDVEVFHGSKVIQFFKQLFDKLRNILFSVFGNQRAAAVAHQNSFGQYGGIPISTTEYQSIATIREKISSLTKSELSTMSTWILNPTNVDILRFLRAKNGNIQQGWTMLTNHARWRISPDGADTVMKENAFVGSELNKEFFWFGIDKNDCLTLVGRTQLHDGKHYDENPRTFAKYVVWMLETAQRDYGAVHNRQITMLIDRAKVPGHKKIENFDPRVIPNLVMLLRHLASVLTENYPEILYSGRIVPAGWFFTFCYKVTSKVMEPKYRDRFAMVSAGNVASFMHTIYDKEDLPPHLGGTATVYPPTKPVIK